MSVPEVYFDHTGSRHKYGLHHPNCEINAIKLAVWSAFEKTS